MSTTILHMSLSLDGYATGPDDDLELLHQWSYPRSGTVSDASMTVIQELFAASAVVMGWRTFDLGQEQNGWYDHPPFKVPMFVPAHSVPERAATAAGNLRFVTDGVVSAVEQAQAEAGDGLVAIVGGATTFQQAFEAGLVDELHLTHVPVVLGDGIRLFDNVGELPLKFELKRVIEAPEVIHTIYGVRKQ
ncbi:dihydrofolate reductase family protein [Actinophytocola sp. KF-1]